MTSFKRSAAALGAAAVLAFSLTACGGDDGGDSGSDSAPADASKSDFCQAFADAFKPFVSLEGDPTEDQFNDFKDAVKDLADVGTPSDISDDQRTGFEAFVKAVDDGSYDDFKNADGSDIPGVSADDQPKAQDFLSWSGKECASELGLPSDSSS